MLSASLDSKSFEDKLKIFSSGLGNIFLELLNRVGQQMTNESKSNAPRRTGRLANAINFIFFDETRAALTTRRKISKSNVWYSNIREHGASIQTRKADWLMFKINGEWKKVKSVKTPAQPFMKPVFDNYFGNENAKGYTELANALIQKINEELN